jgi:hypothetical protein
MQFTLTTGFHLRSARTRQLRRSRFVLHGPFFIAQLPFWYLVRVDLDRFFSAFTMVVDEKRVPIQPWTYGPGHRRKDATESLSDLEDIHNVEYVDQEEIRKDINKCWIAYESYTAGHIPWAVYLGQYHALAGVSAEEVNVTKGALIYFA